MFRNLVNTFLKAKTKNSYGPIRMFATHCENIFSEVGKLVDKVCVGNRCSRVETDGKTVELYFQYFQTEQQLKQSAEHLKSHGFPVRPLRQANPKDPLDIVSLQPILIDLSIKEFANKLKLGNRTAPSSRRGAT